MTRQNLALAAVLFVAAAAVAQPPADHKTTNSRKLVLPIDFVPELRKTIQQVQLTVSRDQGQTWSVEDAVTPDKNHFVLDAKDDGVYWFSMVIRHTDGKVDPTDPFRPPADRIAKYLIDATPPAVRLPVARRDGDDVVLEWDVTDKYPNDSATQVSYKTGVEWVPAPPDAIARRTARFRPATPGPVTVRVAVTDSAGNPGMVMKELPAGTTPAAPLVVATGGSQPATGGIALPPPKLDTPAAPPPATAVPLTIAPAAAPPAPLPVVTPTAPPAPAPAPIITQPTPAPILTTPPPAAPSAPAIATTQSQPAWNPPPAPAVEPSAPLAVSGGTAPTFAPAPAPPTPAPEAPSVQHIRFTQFQLNYQLDAGPSGVRQVDLYVTRDDGRSWVRWSQHDGRENPLRVNLQRGVGSVDGDYGFKLVSVSFANLSDDLPTPGTAPDVRVRVDTTPPLIKVWAIAPDPANRQAVLFNWKAEDANLGEGSTVGIEWAESAAGPWKPVASPEVTAVNVNPAAVARVPNTGTYSWTLPPNLPGHRLVFRFTATDPAGNRSEVVTPPQTVDLIRPKARIQGVVTGAVQR